MMAKRKKGAGGCPKGTKHPADGRPTGVPRGTYRFQNHGEAQRVSPFQQFPSPAAAAAAAAAAAGSPAAPAGGAGGAASSAATGAHPRSALLSRGGGAAGASSSSADSGAPPIPSSSAAAAAGAGDSSATPATTQEVQPTSSVGGSSDANTAPTSAGGSSDSAAAVDPLLLGGSFGSWDAANSTGDASTRSDPDVEPEEAGGVQQLFTRQVKKTINAQVRHFGHGSRRRKLKGRLTATSPWFRPDQIFHASPRKLQVLAQRVYMCVPEYMCPAIGLPDCPHCGRNDEVVSNGWEPGSRLVHAEHDNYYMIAFQYKCKTCAEEGRTHRFAGWHPKVQKRLPRFLLCPALVLRHVAIDTHLVTRIGQSLLSKGGFATLARHLRESHMEEFHMKEERFYFHLSFLRQSAQPFLQEKVEHPECLGKFADKDGYNGKPPGEAALRAAWYVVSEEREPWFQRRAQMVGGKILAGDASYKFTKKVKVDGNRVFQGSYTVMNEHHMVVMQTQLKDFGVSPMPEMRVPLKALARRYQLHGFDPIEVFSTDDCCGDEEVVRETLGPAAASFSPTPLVESGKSDPPLT